LPDHGWSRLCDELFIVPVRGGHNFRGDLPIDREELSAKLVQAIETSLSGNNKRSDANTRLLMEG
jgi:hypothetical protein